MKHEVDGTAYPIPRKPSAYRPTTHFGQMRKTRTDPPITGRVIRKCITEGGVGKSKAKDNCYRFVWSDDGDEWTMVVAMIPEAFERETAKHEVVTAYVAGKHDIDAYLAKWG